MSKLEIKFTLDDAEQALFLEWSPNTEMIPNPAWTEENDEPEEIAKYTDTEWILEKSKRYYYKGMQHKEREIEKAKEPAYTTVVKEDFKKLAVAKF